MRIEQVKQGNCIALKRPFSEEVWIRVLSFENGQIQGRDLGSNARVSFDLRSASSSEEKDNRPTVALLACSQTKSNYKSYAADLYQGTLFRLSLKYAMDVLGADSIFIMSAKHGTLCPYSIVEPYDLGLASLVPVERSAWGGLVWQQLHTHLYKTWGLPPDRFKWFALAGKLYLEPLARHFENHEIDPETPLAGLGIGIQQHRLREALDCGMLLSELYKKDE